MIYVAAILVGGLLALLPEYIEKYVTTSRRCWLLITAIIVLAYFIHLPH